MDKATNSARNRPKIGRYSANFRPKKLKIFFVTKSPIILPKFGWKLTVNWPIFGPKKVAGLLGFEGRASGGLGPPKKPFGWAGFGLSPRPTTSLVQSKANFEAFSWNF